MAPHPMSIRIFALIAPFLLAGPVLADSTSPVFANFQFGDTESTVKAKAQQNVKSGDFVSANSTMIGKDKFEVRFSFHHGHLWVITLIGPEEGSESIDDLKVMLGARYGEPSYQEGGGGFASAIRRFDAMEAMERGETEGCTSDSARWEVDGRRIDLTLCWRTEEKSASQKLTEKAEELKAKATGEHPGYGRDQSYNEFYYRRIQIWDLATAAAIEEEKAADIEGKGRLFK